MPFTPRFVRDITFAAMAGACAIVAVLADQAHAWDAAGHRMITSVAIDGLPADGPAWVKEAGMRDRISDQSTVPDRWRSIKIGQLQHANNPDHYFDVEDLEAYGLTLKDISPLRVEFIKQLMLIRFEKGWKLPPKPVNPARDTDKTQEWPGFLPYAMCEQYGKVQSAFRTVRVLEAINDPARSLQLEQARADASVHMGILSHYVGDTAQPLHTTKHHHGWIGENPDSFTTDRGFHAYIDGAILKLHAISVADIKSSCGFTLKVTNADPWQDVLSHIDRSFQQVKPLYQLKKSGQLEEEEGKAFIVTRLADGAQMLSALYLAAWQEAAPTDRAIEDFKKYDNFVKGATPAGGASDSPPAD